MLNIGVRSKIGQSLIVVIQSNSPRHKLLAGWKEGWLDGHGWIDGWMDGCSSGERSKYSNR